jgi:uncharacterized protein DUF4231
MPSDNDIPTVKPAWMSPIETRQERADYYFRTILNGQREWYSKGARKQKRRYLAFAICVIVLGALISLLPMLKMDWVPYLTAALGAAVSISRAVDALLRPAETWQAYRQAFEGMKRDTACISTTRMRTPPQRTRPAPIASWSSGSKPLSPRNSNYSGSLKPRVGPSRNHRNCLTKAHDRHFQRLPVGMTG